MKTLLFTLAMLCAAAASQAEGEARSLVKAQVQMVAVPMAQALTLIPKLRAAGTFPAADARLQEVLAAGEAELLGWPIVEGFGERRKPELPPGYATVIGTSDSGLEVFYPDEFLPLQLPTGVRTGPARREPSLGEMFPVPAIRAPTGSSARLTGPRLSMGGETVDRQQLILQIKAELIWLRAMEPAIGARADRPDAPSIAQPQFRRVQIESSLHLRGETHQLLAVFDERRAQPRMILFLLHVRIQPAPDRL